MAIIQSLPFGGSGSSYTNMTAEEAIAGTNTEERVISAKVLNDAIDNKILDAVHKSGDETINGDKTFTGDVICTNITLNGYVCTID